MKQNTFLFMKSASALASCILICSVGTFIATLLGSCQKEESDTPIFNINDAWLVDQVDGQQLLTNDQIIYKAISPSLITESFRYSENEKNSEWIVGQLEYALSPDTLLLYNRDRKSNLVLEVEKINEEEMNWKLVKSYDEVETVYPNITYHLRKLCKDYTKLILGTWQGQCTTPGEPNEVHRWRYLANGSYAYLSSNGKGGWEEKEDNEGTYTLHGDLLATSWNNDAETGVKGKACELWNITIKDGKMYWQAMRETGKTIEFTLTKVDE